MEELGVEIDGKLDSMRSDGMEDMLEGDIGYVNNLSSRVSGESGESVESEDSGGRGNLG